MQKTNPNIEALYSGIYNRKEVKVDNRPMLAKYLILINVYARNFFILLYIIIAKHILFINVYTIIFVVV